MFATPVESTSRPLRNAGIASHLRANDPLLQKLILDSPPRHYFNNFSDFCNTLAANDTVSFVKITSPFLFDLTAFQRDTLLDIIGKLPALEELIMYTRPASSLIAALKKASKLKSLKLWKLRFSSSDEIADLVLTLKGCKALQKISIASIQVTIQGNSRVNDQGKIWFQETEGSKKEISIDFLLKAMASLPNMEYIRLKHNMNGGRIQAPSEQTLRLLCQSPRKTLILDSCELSDDQCLVIADELKSNELSLSTLVVTENYLLSAKAGMHSLKLSRSIST